LGLESKKLEARSKQQEKSEKNQKQFNWRARWSFFEKDETNCDGRWRGKTF
jgi:hypothetical protein